MNAQLKIINFYPDKKGRKRKGGLKGLGGGRLGVQTVCEINYYKCK